MRRLYWTLIVSSLFGCQSESDRQVALMRDRLAVGSEVLVIPPEMDGRPWPIDHIPGHDEHDRTVDVKLGTRALVLNDTAHDNPREASLRPVRVNLVDGAHAGDVVTLSRAALRPIPSR